MLRHPWTHDSYAVSEPGKALPREEIVHEALQGRRGHVKRSPHRVNGGSVLRSHGRAVPPLKPGHIRDLLVRERRRCSEPGVEANLVQGLHGHRITGSAKGLAR